MSVALMEPLRPSKKTSAARVVMGGAAGSSRGDGLFNVPANINGLWAAASATSSRPSPSSSTVSRRKKRMQALAQQQVEADKYFIMSQDLAAKDSAVKLLTQEVSALRAALERTERSLKDEAATRAQEYQAASIRIQQLEEALIAAEGTEGQLRSHMAEQEKTLESLSDALHQSAKEPPQVVIQLAEERRRRLEVEDLLAKKKAALAREHVTVRGWLNGCVVEENLEQGEEPPQAQLLTTELSRLDKLLADKEAQMGQMEQQRKELLEDIECETVWRENAQAGQKRAEEKAEAASGRARVASVQLEQAKVTLTELRAKIEQLESSMREAQSRRNALVKTQTARLAERSRESRRIRELEEEVLSAKSIAAKEARALKAEVANARREAKRHSARVNELEFALFKGTQGVEGIMPRTVDKLKRAAATAAVCRAPVSMLPDPSAGNEDAPTWMNADI